MKDQSSTGTSWVPFILLALFYLGGLWQRPMYLEEYAFALRTSQAPYNPVLIRLPGALATLLTAGAIRLFMRKRDPEAGDMAAGLFLALGTVYAAGTAAAAAPFFTLGFTVLVFAFGEWILEKDFRGIPGIALGTGLAWYAGTRLPQIPFRTEYLGFAALGLFPLILILPVLFSGGRRLALRETPERTAVCGAILGLAAIPLGQWTAAMPFLALLAVRALQKYQESNPDMLRLNRLIRHWLKVFLAAAVLLIAGFLLVKSGKARGIPLPGNMVMTVFSILILMIWFFMAARESRLTVKITYFALGAAFFLCGLPAMVPARVNAAHIPAEIVRRLWPREADGIRRTAAVTPELENTLRYAGCARVLTVLPAEKLRKIMPQEQGAAVLMPAEQASAMPPAYRRIIVKSANIAILEYRP